MNLFLMRRQLLQVEGNLEGFIQGTDFRGGQSPHEVSQGGFGQTDQFIAMDRAVMLEPFVDAYFDLGGEAILSCIDRRAGHG